MTSLASFLNQLTLGSLRAPYASYVSYVSAMRADDFPMTAKDVSGFAANWRNEPMYLWASV